MMKDTKHIKTRYGDLPFESIEMYQSRLIDKTFKILGMKDDNCKTLDIYIESFLFELVGCELLIKELQNSSEFISLLAILENLRNNEYENRVVKQQVFKAIKLIKRLDFGDNR